MDFLHEKHQKCVEVNVCIVSVDYLGQYFSKKKKIKFSILFIILNFVTEVFSQEFVPTLRKS